MKKIFTLLSALAVVLVISACTNLIQQDAGLGQVEGSLAYRERIALPDNARITVILSDVSLMDAGEDRNLAARPVEGKGEGA